MGRAVVAGGHRPFVSRPDTLPRVNPRRLLRIAVPTVVLALALAACTTPNVAATVDGSEISDADLQAMLPEFKVLAELQGATCGGAPPGGEAPADPEVACSQQALGVLIQDRLLQNYATANQVTVPQADVDKTLEQIDAGAPQEGAFDALLKKQGVTRAQFGEFVKKLLLFAAVQEEVAGTGMEEEALRKAYEEDKLQFTTIDTAHILVSDQAQADELFAKATKANFAALAEKFSEDPGSAKKGGDLGAIAAASLVPEYANAAANAEPGTIVGPIKSQFGYHIIYVKDVKVKPFKKAAEELTGDASSQQQFFQQWLKDQLEAADIQVNPRYGRYDLETNTVVPVTSTGPASGSSPSAVPGA